MSDNQDSLHQHIDRLIDKLDLLERRVKILESEVGISSSRHSSPAAAPLSRERVKPEPTPTESGSLLESRFGEYGLAWIGNIVLLFGIIFLTQYISRLGMVVPAAIIGYVVVAGVFLLSHLTRKSYSHLSYTFGLTAQVLLFYVTVSLHFFAGEPVVASKTLTLVLILAVVTFQFFMALRKSSTVMSGMAIIMLLITADLSDSSHITLSLTLLASAAATALYFRFGWWKLLGFSIFLAYSVFLIWFLNNPFMGHEMEFVKDHQYGYIYLFMIGAVFSLVALENRKNNIPEAVSIGLILFNGLFFTLILSLFVLSFFKDDFVLLFSLITLYCLGYSVYLKSRTSWKFPAAFFALYGFMALSIAVYGIYGFPRVYWLLALQSLLVVSMALWFRNKIILMMNAGLFVIIYIIYLASSEPVDSVNISFAIVALATARIINWKKERLEIKTEFVRNIYLVAAFVMVLNMLYHAVPGNLVTLSWSIAAVFYFGLSLILKNVKYRYMALATMIATAVYLFIVDLARVEIVYRVLAFLFLAIISIVISIFYVRKMKRSNEEGDDRKVSTG